MKKIQHPQPRWQTCLDPVHEGSDPDGFSVLPGRNHLKEDSKCFLLGRTENLDWIKRPPDRWADIKKVLLTINTPTIIIGQTITVIIIHLVFRISRLCWQFTLNIKNKPSVDMQFKKCCNFSFWGLKIAYHCIERMCVNCLFLHKMRGIAMKSWLTGTGWKRTFSHLVVWFSDWGENMHCLGRICFQKVVHQPIQ